jgi:AcrR family transcriptional regulator
MMRTERAFPSIRSVARHAGVSATALYHHYPDRSGLMAAVARVGFERVVPLLPQLGTGLSPADMFRALFVATLASP